jgi:hypothetical protein
MAARRRDLTKHRNYGLLREYKATLVTRERLSRLGAHGAGIGRNEDGGDRTDTLALLFYVARKQPVAQLSAERIHLLLAQGAARVPVADRRDRDAAGAVRTGPGDAHPPGAGRGQLRYRGLNRNARGVGLGRDGRHDRRRLQ